MTKVIAFRNREYLVIILLLVLMTLFSVFWSKQKQYAHTVFPFPQNWIKAETLTFIQQLNECLSNTFCFGIPAASALSLNSSPKLRYSNSEIYVMSFLFVATEFSRDCWFVFVVEEKIEPRKIAYKLLLKSKVIQKSNGSRFCLSDEVVPCHFASFVCDCMR